MPRKEIDMVARDVICVAYEDFSDRDPHRLYELFRVLNRVMLMRSDLNRRRAASLDASRMCPEARYLLKHLLMLQGRYDFLLKMFNGLRTLQDVGDEPPGGLPLVLSENPTGAHPYFDQVGIIL